MRHETFYRPTRRLFKLTRSEDAAVGERITSLIQRHHQMMFLSHGDHPQNETFIFHSSEKNLSFEIQLTQLASDVLFQVNRTLCLSAEE